MLAPPSPTVQDAKGPLLLEMVTKNMDFQARLPYYKMSKQKSSRPVSVQRSTQWAESCGDLPSAIQTAGGQMREFGTVTAKFRSGRKILHWTERLLSSPEIADVDLNGLSNKWRWGIQACSSLRVKGGAWRSCWLPRSSKAPGGALCTLWGALPTPSLENLKNSLKHLC